MFLATLVMMTCAVPATAPVEPAVALVQAQRLAAADRFGEAEPLFREALQANDRFVKREAYTHLLNLYLRSGRPDKAVAHGKLFREWLREIGDTESFANLELTFARCYFELGYPDTAEKHLTAALEAKPPLSAESKLEALRLRAEIATSLRADNEKQHWLELERAATETLKQAENANAMLRVNAGRYVAEAQFRRGDTDAAIATLTPFPALHDKLNDTLGKRDTLRQLAKLMSAKGRYDDAAKLFQESLELHRKQQPKKYLIAGDILADWAAAAHAAQKVTDANKLRAQAALEYKVALESPAEDANGSLAAFMRLQSLTRAAKQFAQARDLTRNAGERWANDPLLDARLKADQGGLELLAAAYQTARKLLRQSLADHDANETPNLRELPKVLVNLATAEMGCDDAERAETLLARATDLYRKHKLRADSLRVECDYLRGVIAARKGDFASAMNHFRAGLVACDAVGTGAEPVRFNLWLNVALIHKEQGDATAASESLQKAATVLAKFAEPDDVSSAMLDAVRADLFVTQGQITPAMALVPNLEAACAKHGSRVGYLWATAKHVRALDSLAKKDLVQAERIWSELADSQRKDGNVLLARTLNFLGVCAELRGQHTDAITRFEEARKFQTEHPRCPPTTRAITLWRLAVLSDKAGKRDEAKKLLLEVFDIADRARLNTFGEAAQRAQFFSQFAPAFELFAAWCARDDDGEGVLRVVARSRSRTLLDQMLAAGVDPRDRLTGDMRVTLLARETNARREISRLRSQVMLLPVDQLDDPKAKKLIAELETAQKEYADAWREIANADPLTRVLTDPKFADTSLAQVRTAAHKAGGVLLTYMIGRDQSYAVLSTDPGAKPRVFRLGVPRTVATDIGDAPTGDLVASAGFRGVVIKSNTPQPERTPTPATVELVPLTDVVVARLVNHYLQKISDPSFSPTRGIAIVSRTPGTATRATNAELLGDAVLPPALRDAIRAAQAKRVVLVPDGALHKLPFEALLVSGNPAPKYVLDELPAVCYSSSLAALAVVLNRERVKDANPSLLTVGDPAYPEVAGGKVGQGGALPRLPYTATESKKVRQFFATDKVTAFESESATEANVVAALPGKRFIHLAAHGFADEAFGNAFAAVALTPPARGTGDSANDGFLTLHEIMRLKLTGCELTVLSACVTNVGPQRPLEAGVTLAGAFQSAGSRGVMASCWSVDDRATADMMAEFFGAVRPANGEGLSYPEALRKARLAVRSKPGWESPFFWAPFVYVGPPE
jgi:CHAT domain-containing protein